MHDSEQPGCRAQINTLKAVLKVRTDKELSQELGISQQAISQAKKRKALPNSWLKKVRNRGLYEAFLNADMGGFSAEGTADDLFKFIIQEYLFDTVEPRLARENLKRYLSTPDRMLDFIALIIVTMASRKSKFKCTEDQLDVLRLIVMKSILPRAVDQILEYMEGIGSGFVHKQISTISKQNTDK
jgi:hypothetical protein